MGSLKTETLSPLFMLSGESIFLRRDPQPPQRQGREVNCNRQLLCGPPRTEMPGHFSCRPAGSAQGPSKICTVGLNLWGLSFGHLVHYVVGKAGRPTPTESEQPPASCRGMRLSAPRPTLPPDLHQPGPTHAAVGLAVPACCPTPPRLVPGPFLWVILQEMKSPAHD